MAKIGEKTVNECTRLLGELLEEKMDELDIAYKNAGGDPLDISLKVKISLDESGGNRVAAGISFAIEKAKGSAMSIVDEEQMAMEFPMDSTS